MPPFIASLAKSIVRWAVVASAAYLAGHANIHLQEDQIGQIVTYLTPVLAMLVWSVIKEHGGWLKYFTALKIAGVSDHDIAAIVKDPTQPNPSVMASRGEVPQ